MALEKTTRAYEVLFRIHENGTINSHVQEITEIKDNGVIISATLQPAIPLAMASPEFDAVTTEINMAILSDRDSLSIGLSNMTTDRNALTVQLSDMTAERDALKSGSI